MRRHLVLLIVPAIFILDRWTKVLVGQDISYLEAMRIAPFFSIVHVRNAGGAFGIFAQYELATYIFTFLPLAIIAVLLFVIFAHDFSPAKMISLASILGGAMGNMYDRIFHGYVVDFLDFYYARYHWPAFNVADIAVSFGVCFWLFLELKNSLEKGKGPTS
jgi:signal peptidase II